MSTSHTIGQNHDRIPPPPGNGDLDRPSAPHLALSQQSRQGDISIAQRMLSAVTGSILTSLLVTPLDVVRVRLQAQQKESQRRSFNSTIDGLRKIARNEGVFTLWRGLSPTLLMAIPANVIYFAGYDWLRTGRQSPMAGRVSDAYAPLAAGSMARVLAAVAVSPIEMLRTRMQASQSGDKRALRTTVGGLRDMVSREGYTTLWRGLTLTFWRDVPFSALYWWGYEYGRKRLDETRKRTSLLPGRSDTGQLPHSALLADSFIAGASSGAVAAFITTPFDVGKTRQQTVLHDPNVKLKDIPEGRSMPRFLWHIYQTEGAAGLFKGWAARCLKVAPACAIMISSYEMGKRMASNAKDKRDGTQT